MVKRTRGLGAREWRVSCLRARAPAHSRASQSRKLLEKKKAAEGMNRRLFRSFFPCRLNKGLYMRDQCIPDLCFVSLFWLTEAIWFFFCPLFLTCCFGNVLTSFIFGAIWDTPCEIFFNMLVAWGCETQNSVLSRLPCFLLLLCHFKQLSCEFFFVLTSAFLQEANLNCWSYLWKTINFFWFPEPWLSRFYSFNKKTRGSADGCWVLSHVPFLPALLMSGGSGVKSIKIIFADPEGGQTGSEGKPLLLFRQPLVCRAATFCSAANSSLHTCSRQGESECIQSMNQSINWPIN